MVWIVTVTRYGWPPMETRTVEVCQDEAAARKAVEDHGQFVGVYMDDWAVRLAGGEVVAVTLEGDDCEVTATRWEVKT